MPDRTNRLALFIPLTGSVTSAQQSFRDLHSFFSRASSDLTIILLAFDRSHRVLRDHADSFAHQHSFFQVYHSTKPIGSAIREAFQKFQAETQAMIDLSLSIPLAEIFQILTRFQLDPNLQLIIGERTSPPRSWREQFFTDLIHNFWQGAPADPFCPLFVVRNQAGRLVFENLTSQTMSLTLEVWLKLEKHKTFQQKVRSTGPSSLPKLPILKTWLELNYLRKFCLHGHSGGSLAP